jgi:hypothetical protein
VTKVATQGVVNKNIQQQVDSLARLAIDEQAEHLLNSLEEKQTTLIFFDTDKSPDDSSGLPPIKAIAHQEVKREEQKIEKQQNQVQSEIELKEETATTVEVEEKASWWDILKQHIMYILLIPVLIIALWATYKLIKFLK